MIDLYIYYQVREDKAAALQLAVSAMQARLSAAHGVAAQLKRRPEAKDGLHTWMEIYPAVAGNFEAILKLAVHDAALPALTAGPRHTEVFMDIITCA